MDIKIEVNNKVISAKKGETILSALNRNGIKVPTICNLKELSPTGACRMCVVEVEGKENLIPSCSHPVEEWMKIKTHSPRVIQTRKTIVELLLSDHPDDCLYCERNGNCELQVLAEELHIRERKINGIKKNLKIDKSSPGIIRDPSKCILCGRCVRVCEEIMTVATLDFSNRGTSTQISTAFNKPVNFSNCIACGQCVINCPTGALIENVDFTALENYLHSPETFVIAQISPTVAVSLGELFNIKPGKNLNHQIHAALKKMGFNLVFETGFGVDYMIDELKNELISRIKKGKYLPMFSSCCPSWVKYAEQYAPALLNNLSMIKSPQQLMGSLLKEYAQHSGKKNIEQIRVVSVMPCTAKKFESKRIEHSTNGFPLVDTVLTTRELARFIRMNGIDLLNIEPQMPDAPFDMSSGAAYLTGISGGTTEALMKNMLFGENKNIPKNKISVLRSSKDLKEIKIKYNNQDIGFAVINGLKNINKKLNDLKKRNDIHFIEVMACQGGCVNGGGQPIRASDVAIKSRCKVLQNTADKEQIISIGQNPKINEIKTLIFGTSKEKASKNILHTSYNERNVLL